MSEIKELSKSYGKKKALDGVSFSVEKGEILGFLGPNGAGKSTTMNIITGYLSSTSGSVCVDGFDILDNPNEVKRRIGYLPEQPPLYTDMTVSEYLDFVFDLKKIKGVDKKAHIAEIIGKVGISDVYTRRISNLSKGYRQRVGLAQALLGNPEVLILDEPTVGLDPIQIIEIRNLIKELGSEHTVILSSHILSEINAVCERVIIIKDGRLVAQGSPEELSGQYGGMSVQLTIDGDKDKISAVLASVDGVGDIKASDSSTEGAFDFEIACREEEVSELSKNLFFALANANMPILMQKTVKASLEDVFIELTENDEPLPEEPAQETAQAESAAEAEEVENNESDI